MAKKTNREYPPVKFRLRLREIVPFQDFRKTEQTLFSELPRATQALLVADIDCLCLISGTAKLASLVHGYTELGKLANGRKFGITVATKLRLDGRLFSPEWLPDYTLRVGIELLGLPTQTELWRKKLLA